MSSSLSMLAIRGSGDHLDALLEVLGKARDPDTVDVVAGSGRYPEAKDHSVKWVHFEGGTLFELDAIADPSINQLVRLAQRTRSELLYTHDPTHLVMEIIVHVASSGEVLRHVANIEGQACFANGTPLCGVESSERRAVPAPDDELDWDMFDYAERTPDAAMTQFIGFSAHRWRYRDTSTGVIPPTMTATSLLYSSRDDESPGAHATSSPLDGRWLPDEVSGANSTRARSAETFDDAER